MRCRRVRESARRRTSRSRPPGRTGSPGTTGRRRRTDSFGTRTSVSGRRTRSRRDSPTRSQSTARFGFSNVERVTPSNADRADVALGWGPFPKDELEALVARFPEQLRLSTAPATEFFFLNTRVSHLRRRSRATRDRLRVRSRDVREQAGDRYAPACRILPAGFPGYHPRARTHPEESIVSARARQLARTAGETGTRVTVWVPAPHAAGTIHGLGASVARLPRQRSRNPVDPKTGAATPYFDKVSDPRTRAQIGFGGWAAITRRCRLSPADSQLRRVHAREPVQRQPRAFCNPSIDAKMARATELQATNHPPRRCSGKKSRTTSSHKRRSCQSSTGATSTSSPSASATTSTTRSGACCSASSGSSSRRQAGAGSKRSFSVFGGTRVGYSRVKHARQTESSGSSVASCIPSTER